MEPDGKVAIVGGGGGGLAARIVRALAHKAPTWSPTSI